MVNFIKKEDLVYFLIGLLLLLPIFKSLLRPGFFTTDDGDWMIIRFSSFHQEFIHGQIPVRWLGRLNDNYGYPVATFLYPGFMYLAEIPKILGFGFVDSIKAVFLVSVIVSFTFSFLYLKALFDRYSAVIGSLAYVYNPYFLWDIYKRGSVGEILALSIIPFILWSINRQNKILTSLGYGLLILSHNTLSLILMPFLFLYQLIKFKKLGLLKNIMVAFSGLGLSAFFWLPALVELKYTAFYKMEISRWSDFFLRGQSLYLVGWMNIVVLIAASWVILKKRLTNNKVAVLFISIFTIGLFLSSPLSYLIWQIFPLGKLVQFPFRFLSLTIMASSYLLSYSCYFFLKNRSNKIKTIVTLIVAFFIVFANIEFAQPKEFVNKGDSFYATNEATTTVSDEYMPVWVKEKPTKRPNQLIEKIGGNWIQINQIYWPGWKIYAKGEPQTIHCDNKYGLMRIFGDFSLDSIKPNFSETPLRMFCDFISITTFIFLVYLYVKRKIL